MAVGHDRGHVRDSTPIDQDEHDHADWERLAEAVLRCLREVELVRVDELRRGIESLDPETYERLGYFHRWVPALELILTEKHVLATDEIDARAAALAGPGGEQGL